MRRSLFIKSVLVLTLVIVFWSGALGLGLRPQTTHAQFGFSLGESFDRLLGSTTSCGIFHITACAIELFRWGLTEVSLLVIALMKVLVGIAAGFMQIMIALNASVISSSIVTIGFRIALNLANLGFILAVIMIAFGTILRIEQYQLKKTFVRLVIAAILINFSLLIAGGILDFSNIVSDSFFARLVSVEPDGSPGDPSEFSGTLSNALNLQNDIEIDTSKIDTTIKASQDLLILFINFCVTIAFNTIVLITFAALALMIMARYIALVILLVIMPLTWFFWVIPSLSGLASQWWRSFLRWTLFLPAVSFFIYLTLISADEITTTIDRRGNQSEAISQVNDSFLFLASGAQIIINGIVLSGLLIGGLYAAQQMGITGAGAAVGIAKKWGKRAGLAPSKLGLRTGLASSKLGLRTGLASSKLGYKYLGGERAAKATSRGVSNVLVRTPFKGLANRAAQFGSREGNIKEYREKNLSSLTNAQLQREADHPGVFGNVRGASILQELNGRGLKIPPEKAKAYAQALKRTHAGIDPEKISGMQELLKRNFHLAGKLLGKTDPVEIEAVIEKYTKKADFTEVDTGDEGIRKAIARYGTTSQIGQFAKNASSKQLSEIREDLVNRSPENIKGLSELIASQQAELKDAKELDDKPRIAALQSSLKDNRKKRSLAFTTEKDEGKKHAYSLLESFDQTIGVPALEELTGKTLRSNVAAEVVRRAPDEAIKEAVKDAKDGKAGKLESISVAELKRFGSNSENQKDITTILQITPELAHELTAGTKSIEQAIHELKPEQAKNIATSSLQKFEVASNLDVNQLTTIVTQGPQAKRNAVRDALGSKLTPALKNIASELAETENKILSANARGDAALASRLRTEFNRLEAGRDAELSAPTTTPEAKKAYELLAKMESLTHSPTTQTP
ncbi:MAG: hypothetical protein COU08_00935 [Candidatus Harrisonbacteria bacterium CG10_big_fil_rev_8_21_14_0_10_42_17]|uniref:Uncharacterized protein n=1 Tax=Candidatus Harrisonbacteria bacterium CG10_big_fil_rev_8_21_14_0_10_42_17 TaxID=1974584 RepID=A0A2M6WIX8_9BACT|nr:MAG: hypothetical protein COU08_00935 [Candidatus Harrisonbacteria bacterium CG10_big_fil_rev_8_21_14_0_10_42_17]